MNQSIRSTNYDLHTQYDMDNLSTIITNENLVHDFKTPVWLAFEFEPALHPWSKSALSRSVTSFIFRFVVFANILLRNCLS